MNQLHVNFFFLPHMGKIHKILEQNYPQYNKDPLWVSKNSKCNLYQFITPDNHGSIALFIRLMYW